MEQKERKKRKRWLIVIGVIAALIIFRIFLPYIVLHFVNKKINEIPEYSGYVSDLDLSLYRGAYQLEGIELKKMNGQVPEPFFSSPHMDLSIQWRALFQGEIVGEVVITEPRLNFIKGATEEQSQTNIDSSWVDVVKDLSPVRINRLEVRNGEIHYKDLSRSPKIDLFMNNIYGTALNLTNAADSTSQLPAQVDVRGNTLGKGKFNIHMALDPLEEPTAFDLNAELTDVNLAELNDFLKAYANFDVSAGTFGLYMEIAAKEGRFEGYVKPLVKDIEVIEWGKEEEGGFFQKIWETIVGAGTELLENRGEKREQIATRIPLSGELENPDVDIITTIWMLLKNAFIQALMPSLDNSINISNVTGNKNSSNGGLLDGEGKEEKD